MKAQNIRIAGVLFIIGAFLGSILASSVSSWLASAVHPAVRQLPFDQPARVLQSLFFGIWAGVLLASVPLAALLSGRLSHSYRLLLILLAVAALAVLFVFMVIRSIAAEVPPPDVVATFRITDVSFFWPAFVGVIAVLISSLVARCFQNDRNA